METNNYNKDMDSVFWSRRVVDTELRTQITLRLMRYNQGQLKLQILHQKLDTFDAPVGRVLNRYTLPELDGLISGIIDAKTEMEKIIKNSNNVVDILNRITKGN